MKNKACCEEARREMAQAQSVMSSWSPISYVHRSAEKVRDTAQNHITNCAKPRRMALAARIVKNCGGR